MLSEIILTPGQQAVLATIAISVLPTLVLLLVPFCHSSRAPAANGGAAARKQSPVPPRLLRILLAFAVGGLLGDAILHLIPHAVFPHDHAGDHAHSHGLGHAHSHSAVASAGHAVVSLPPAVAPAVVVAPAAAAHSHSHDHDHDHDHGHGHGHGHAHAHSHAHSHDDHGHGHAHGHDHDHGHGHSHGGRKCNHDHSNDHIHALGGHAHGHGHDHSHHEHAHKKVDAAAAPAPAAATHAKTDTAAAAAAAHKHEHEHDHTHDDHGHNHGHGHAHSHDDHAHSHDAHAHGHAHGHDHGHDHGAFTRVGLLVLAGMGIFFIIERVVAAARAAAGLAPGHGHSHGGHGHGHGNHSAAAASSSSKDESESEQEPEQTEDSDIVRLRRSSRSRATATKPKAADNANESANASKSKSKTGKRATKPAVPAADASADSKTEVASTKGDDDEEESTLSVLTGSPAALLNLVADVTHNFTDGLAIAAAFSAGQGLGISTLLAVLVHEVPHELGDFAVLVQAGLSPQRALKMQFVTAIGALLGVFAGLLAADTFTAASTVILPLTAGGFIYVALVSVLPDLLKPLPRDVGESDCELPGDEASPAAQLVDTASLVAAMAAGVYLMVLIIELE